MEVSTSCRVRIGCTQDAGSGDAQTVTDAGGIGITARQEEDIMFAAQGIGTGWKQPVTGAFRIVACGIAALGLEAGASLALAQGDYPTRLVRLIAPFPAGGVSDILCRLLAQKLGDAMGQRVVVENRPGAAGNIGHESAAKAPPDGYTLILSSVAPLVTNQFLYKRLGFDPYNDFAPVSLVATSTSVLVVHPSLPARSVSELAALAKARPGQLDFGSGGAGTPSHLSGEIFKTALGVQIGHVPYRGGVLAVNALVGGEIGMAFAPMVPAVPPIKSRRLRALAVTSEQRSETLPDVPTMAEAGMKESFPQSWWAINAPRGTPGPVISRLNAKLAQIIEEPEVRERYKSLGLVPAHSTPERVSDLVKSEASQMAKILKATGIKPE